MPSEFGDDFVGGDGSTLTYDQSNYQVPGGENIWDTKPIDDAWSDISREVQDFSEGEDIKNQADSRGIDPKTQHVYEFDWFEKTIKWKKRLENKEEDIKRLMEQERTATRLSRTRGEEISPTKFAPSDAFTATDIRMHVLLDPDNMKPQLDSGVAGVMNELTSLHSFYLSSFRATPQARPIGHVNPAGYARATRTVAGSMSAVTTRYSILRSLIYLLDATDKSLQDEPYYGLDQLPPIDLVITFNNEYGAGAFRIIKAVQFVTTEDNFMVGVPFVAENMQFVAMDATPIVALNDIDPSSGGMQKIVREIDSSFFNRISQKANNIKTYKDIFKSDVLNDYALFRSNYLY